ncbi:HEPN domain-containing protein [Chloracidobacterium thermophilum]|nr:HEPN domain-containing protein [Chloracidobacterium thermophilum]
MEPHLEEAWRSLRLADRDIKAFEVLKKEPEVHLSIVYFHAQQAVEKSLKAVLFAQQIEIHAHTRFGQTGASAWGSRHRVAGQGRATPPTQSFCRCLPLRRYGNRACRTGRYDEPDCGDSPLGRGRSARGNET